MCVSVSSAGRFWATAAVDSQEKLAGVVAGEFTTDSNCTAEGNDTICVVKFTSSGTLYADINSSHSSLEEILANNSMLLNVSTSLVAEGGRCEFNAQCESGICDNSTCAPFSGTTTTLAEPGSPFGISLTPASEISNYVVVSTESLFSSALKNPLGYMLGVLAIALLVIIILRRRREKKTEENKEQEAASGEGHIESNGQPSYVE